MAHTAAMPSVLASYGLLDHCCSSARRHYIGPSILYYAFEKSIFFNGNRNWGQE
jgi:hypothetical protein